MDRDDRVDAARSIALKRVIYCDHDSNDIDFQLYSPIGKFRFSVIPML